jgi:hypothetical protein
MAHEEQFRLTTTVVANDKLLKALLTLLSLKDEHLLDELTTVFLFASECAEGDDRLRDAAWAQVRQDLAMIANLVDGCETPSTAPALDS